MPSLRRVPLCRFGPARKKTLTVSHHSVRRHFLCGLGYADRGFCGIGVP